MFKAGLVAVLKVDGKIVREQNSEGTSTVHIPFGSTYTIGFKNNDTRRAVVSIFVDGEDAMNGSQLVVNGNSESELKGRVNESLAKNGFKFIEKTQEISDFRGDKIDDGIIRIEFQFENPPVVFEPLPKIIKNKPSKDPWDPYVPKDPWNPYPPRPIWYSANNSGILRSSSLGLAGPSCSVNNCSANVSETKTSDDIVRNKTGEVSTAGITVAGSVVNQKFSTTHVRDLNPTKHVIVFEIKGLKRNGQKIQEPILSKKSLQCPTCGRNCKSKNQFCPNCGTCLV